jgi:transposase
MIPRGKTRLLGISKRGDRYLRRLLILGARAVLARTKRAPGDWLERLKPRCHPNIVAVALANKTARIIWALLAHDREYMAGYRKRPAGAAV